MQLIRYPLSRLSQKKLINFRNDIQNINEKVRIYNENILNERREKNKDKIKEKRKEYMRHYNEQNKEKYREYRRNYYLKNKKK